jgi:hypothetical protein
MMKTMLILFSIFGALYIKSLFQSVNQVDYLEVLRHVRDVAQGKWPEMWIAGTWYLIHNNAQLTQHR